MYFIFGCTGSSLLCKVFSSRGGHSLLWCVVFSLQWLLLLQRMGSKACGLQQLWHVGSAVAASGLQSTGSTVEANGLSCSMAHGVFPDQGSNSCLLHWQTFPLPLSHQGSPRFFDDGHSDPCEVIPHCSFYLHFSNNSYVEHFFMCLLAICISSLE